MRLFAGVLLLSLVTAACGSETVSMSAPTPRYKATGTVLEDEQGGPRFCTFVATSLPPQCDGTELVGWDWSTVRHESRRGTRWGRYTVVATWDGNRLTLAEPPKAPQPAEPHEEPSFTSPCPVPAGGWKPIDPAKATQETLSAAMEAARKSPRYAGTWVDQSYLGNGTVKEAEANDPTKIVLNFKFTDDLEGHERRLRKIWGGALCLSPAKHTEARLETIQGELNLKLREIQSSSVNTIKNRVDVTVLVATDELRQSLDTTYGPETIHVSSVFTPVTD